MNDPDCAAIVYRDGAGEIVREDPILTIPYVFRLVMPTHPGSCTFVDANGVEIR